MDKFGNAAESPPFNVYAERTANASAISFSVF